MDGGKKTRLCKKKRPSLLEGKFLSCKDYVFLCVDDIPLNKGRVVDPNQYESTNRTQKVEIRTIQRKRPKAASRLRKSIIFSLPERSEGSGELLVESLVSDGEHLADTLEDALSELGIRILRSPRRRRTPGVPGSDFASTPVLRGARSRLGTRSLFPR